MSGDRPKPPRPPFIPSRPGSDPSMRAAGMTRPQVKTDPSIRASMNDQTAKHELERHGSMLQQHDDRLAALESDRDAWKRHAAKVEHALGVENIEPPPAADSAPDGQSDPPPGTERRKKPKTKVDTIELDSLKAKYGVYVFFGLWLVQTVLTYFHILPGAK